MRKAGDKSYICRFFSCAVNKLTGRDSDYKKYGTGIPMIVEEEVLGIGAMTVPPKSLEGEVDETS